MLNRLPLLTRTLIGIFAFSAAALLFAQGDTPAPDGEQILSYNSDVTVNPDSTLLVRETISVFALDRQIKHGIYRDFPTHYQDRFGNPYIIHFEVVSVERDGQPEGSHLERLPNGLRIYMGRNIEKVPQGEHTYELTYIVDREIGLFPDHDELYWNVTGNGRAFPIQTVSATLHLPRGIVREAILLDAYTGIQGSAGTDYAGSADNQSNATLHTTRPLGPDEGLTIVVRWPKGFVRPPTDEQKYQYFLEDNQATLIGLAGLFVALLYYTAAWLLVGRDPAPGIILPRSEPPRGFSPAALRYVWRMAFDQKALVANLVDLAVKKQLAILQDPSGAFILGRLKSDPQFTSPPSSFSKEAAPLITSDERLVLDKLFASDDTIQLEPVNCSAIGGAIEALHQSLRSSLEKSYLLTHALYLIPGLLISLATVVRCGFSIQGTQHILVLGIAVWLLLWSLGCAALAGQAFHACRNALSDPHHAPTARRQALSLTAISLSFLIGEIAGLAAMVWATSVGVAATLLLLAVMNYTFHILLKSPTRKGRALLDQIEGFRMFLAETGKDQPEAHTPAEETPKMLEKLLPYAMALNVEKVWSEKFAAALAQTTQAGAAGYSPEWYSGPGWDPITAATFANTLENSFSSALSSSTTAHGSASGSSRSSGRRRRGGGRGGW
jgi:hypothetical protein